MHVDLENYQISYRLWENNMAKNINLAIFETLDINFSIFSYHKLKY